MKLAGWQLSCEPNGINRRPVSLWVVRVPHHHPSPLFKFRDWVVVTDTHRDQAISRAFGYFMQGVP